MLCKDYYNIHMHNMSEVLFGAPMHVLACRKRGLKLVRGRAVGTGPQNGCRIASLNCHGQSLVMHILYNILLYT